jgi:hypothetical protein
MLRRVQPLDKSTDVTIEIIKHVIPRHSMREVTTVPKNSPRPFSELHKPCMLFRERIPDEIERALPLR